MKFTSKSLREIALLSVPVALLLAVPVVLALHSQKSDAVSGRLIGTWRSGGAVAPYVLTTFKANGDWEERCFDGSGSQEQLFKGRYIDSGNTICTFDTKRYCQILGVDAPVGIRLDSTKTKPVIQQARVTGQAAEPTFLLTIVSTDWKSGVIKVRLPPPNAIGLTQLVRDLGSEPSRYPRQ